jgi:hypothetical protein
MNRTIKDATVKRYHDESHGQLRTHLALFVDAYNHARRLKTLRGLTPYEFVGQAWTREPRSVQAQPVTPPPGTVQLASVFKTRLAVHKRVGSCRPRYGSATPLSCYAVDDRSVRCAELAQQRERSCIIASF